ncbi:uncharacterized protein LOC129947953 [Eupeodes corollae]|uniref:uncharacterized protein LOC129947953 n=1 Tax=Eupeodes corollae TaxID=290404 RepID=UPI00249109C1|nr:uncharacterized protein LOC129947953 [Eupeodes corollae]
MYRLHAIVLILCGILITISRGDTIEDGTKQTQSQFCKNVRSQHSLNIQEITGLWYGSEIIAHTESSPGTYYYDTCVLIHLTDITQQMAATTERAYAHGGSYKKSPHLRQDPHNRYLRLAWNERENDLEYTLNYTEANPGLWMSIGDQRGTMLDLQYSQFRGTIQVAKAVHDHIVLTFCDFKVNSTFFTIVLTRQKQGLGEDGLRSIRSLLARRGLATDSIRKVCSSSATHIISSMTLSIILSMFLFLRSN